MTKTEKTAPLPASHRNVEVLVMDGKNVIFRQPIDADPEKESMVQGSLVSADEAPMVRHALAQAMMKLKAASVVTRTAPA